MDLLSNRMRPQEIDELFGQDNITAPDSLIKKMIKNEKMFSLILYGPPGSGKTSLALILAAKFKVPHHLLNAATCNKKDIENAFQEARMFGHSILIIDEVHRLNKDKQDILLPEIESGLITLIGATTANPFIAINPALRSRCHLVEFKELSKEAIIKQLHYALISPRGLDNQFRATDEALTFIARAANGDARYALNALEICALAADESKEITQTVTENTLIGARYLSDKNESGHYDALSALQKSIRGSDVDAAIFYLGRILQSGDFENLFRRLIVCAYEDVGLANPAACARMVQAVEACRTIGMPEMRIVLAVATIDLALSPKSKSAEKAIDEAGTIFSVSDYPVPRHLRMVTGDHEDDKYPYDRPDLWEKIAYLPEMIADVSFYRPNTNSAYEKALAQNHQRLKTFKRRYDLKNIKD